MQLYSSAASPFGRKVKIALGFLGLAERVTVVATDTLDPASPIRTVNPLGKIPALALEDGTVLYDSRVILEYLDHLAGGGRILPMEPAERFAALTLQALADGLTDASILTVYEARFRDEAVRSAKWLDHQAGKIERALAVLEAETPGLERITVGEIATACALGYLDLRFDGRWREGHPRLADWLQGFSARIPAFEATRMKG